jgi:DNA-binding MarR family transcriptional regulator
VQELPLDTTTDAVLAASRALVAVAVRSLGEVTEDVTLPQFRALVVLCGRGPTGMTDLAEEIGGSPSTATRLCDRLLEKGLIDRRHRPENRREVEVAATKSGARLVDKVTARRRHQLEDILAKVPAGKLKPMVGALQAFADAAGEVPDQAWDRGWDL